MSASRNVFLVGPMGAGKSTIGRLLAERLHLPFLDADREIEARTGADIPWIFDVEGEAGFREREAAIIAELTAREGVVLATGGGAILRADNRRCLQGRGTVVYLSATLEQLVARTARDKKRPLLNTPNPQAVIERLLQERDPLYREVADLVVTTDDRTPKSVAQEIARRLPEAAQ